jgi:hypothetical protein
VENRGYDSGGTVGGKWGCAVSALVGIPLFSGALLISSMGHCAPDVDCVPNWQLFAGAAGLTIVVGIGTRAAINAILARLKNDR